MKENIEFAIKGSRLVMSAVGTTVGAQAAAAAGEPLLWALATLGTFTVLAETIAWGCGPIRAGWPETKAALIRWLSH